MWVRSPLTGDLPIPGILCQRRHGEDLHFVWEARLDRCLLQDPRIPLLEFFFAYLVFDGLFIHFLSLGVPVVSASDAGDPLHNDWHYVRT